MKINIQELGSKCLQILENQGLNKDQSLLVFEDFLEQELSGNTCHGFQSFSSFAATRVNSDGEPEIIQEDDTHLFIDGKRNLGQIVCHTFIPKLIKKAKEKHIAMMGIVNMHSYQTPGTYARLAAKEHLVSVIFNYGGWPRIAPTGSIDPVFGTNPIAIGIPSNEDPLVLDMATSKIAMMKVRRAMKLGEEIPTGVAINKDGKPTVDPKEALQGALLPFGDYKGAGLALMIELLTKTLFKVDIHDKTKANRGFFFIFLDPSVFQPIEEFKKDVSQYIQEIKTKRKSSDTDEIFVPGERSSRQRKINEKMGTIDLDSETIKEIDELLGSVSLIH
ncbi:Ldh family oxidoreductase [Candidatus Uhrbacteria bacterium]|nr:Ldh family oxidoreductase [Candidatus Uhrbacteria bacterium]